MAAATLEAWLSNPTQILLRQGKILSPFQGLNSFRFVTQGGACFTSLALGYFLSGLQPFGFGFTPSPDYLPTLSSARNFL
jgi:hypothetical protein